METQTAATEAAFDYFAARGLSNSGMKDLAVSPLRYWHKHLNPNAPKDEPTPEMQFGSAVHCFILEPSEFHSRYACESVPPVECLRTIEDMRGYLRSKGREPKGTRKADLIAQVQTVPDALPILDVLETEHAQEHAGKVIFKVEDWNRIHGTVAALMDEPRIQEILSEGQAEVPMFATDPETGVTLKAKMDWVRPDLTLDIKTFRQQRGKSIDKSVADAIWYEGYYRQGYFYTKLRGLQERGMKRGCRFVLAFVESDEPHEVRIKELTPNNLYWTRAGIEVRGLIAKYAECMKHFGTDKPWRYAQEVDALVDEELPGVAY